MRAFRWSDFLGTARFLSEQNDEATRRTAISRAYYAVYGEAHELLKSEGWSRPQNKSFHKSVIEELSSSPRRPRQSLGRRLHSLKQSRVKADYEQNVITNEATVADAISDATSLLQLIDDIRNS